MPGYGNGPEPTAHQGAASLVSAAGGPWPVSHARRIGEHVNGFPSLGPGSNRCSSHEFCIDGVGDVGPVPEIEKLLTIDEERRCSGQT